MMSWQVSLDAEDIRDEKVKVLRSMKMVRASLPGACSA